VSGEPPEKPAIPDLQSLFEAPLRYQAALTSETLRQVNAPIVEALARQQEFAEALTAAAQQVAAVAAQVEALARQHTALTKALRAALGPYLRYVELLGDVADPKRGPGQKRRP
jgi:ABC-type transporter Mla subunit MlaD